MIQVFIGEIQIGTITFDPQNSSEPWFAECANHAAIKQNSYSREEQAKNFFRMSVPVPCRSSVRFILTP